MPAIDVELFDSLDAVERDAAGALDRERQPYLYDSIEWLKLTREHVLPDARLCVARARDRDGRCAWLFLRETADRRADTFASWYTLAFSPVFTGFASIPSDLRYDQRLPALLAIVERLRPRFDRVTLSPMDEEDDYVSLLKRAFAETGWATRRSVATTNWIAETDEHSFDNYWAQRPSRLQNTVARKGRQTDFKAALLDTFDADAWSQYEQVYARSWKMAEGSPAFLRAFAERAGAWGSLRLGIGWLDGRPVAAQFWTVDGGTATIHKLAHDEAAKAGSPGTLLTAAMFEYVLDHDRPMIVDFGTGDDAFKADWMDVKRPLYRLDAYNLRSPGGVADAGLAAVRALVRGFRTD